MAELLTQVKNSYRLLRSRHRTLFMLICMATLIKVFTALVVPRATQMLFDSIQRQDVSGSFVSIGVALMLIASMMLLVAWMNIFGDAVATELGFIKVRNGFGDMYTKPVADLVGKHTAGEVYQRMQAGCHSSIAIWFGLVDLTSGVISLLLIFLMMGSVSMLILGIYLLIPIITVAYTAFSYRTKKRINRSVQARDADRMAGLQELLSNAELLESFNAQEWMAAKYRDARDAFFEAQQKSTVFENFLSILQDAVDFLLRSAFAFAIRLPLTPWGAIGVTFVLFENVKSKSAEVYASLMTLPNATVPLGRLMQILESDPILTADHPSDIVLEGVGLRYGERAALEDVRLRVAKGDKVALIGKNGSGKTSLLKIILGLTRAESGSVSTPYPTYGDRKQGFSIALAAHQLYQTTLYDNVAMGDDAVPSGRADCCLRQLSVDECRDKPIDQLSLGERQRGNLARALVKDASVLVLDEPTSSLDPSTSLRVMKRILGRDQTVLFATHDMEVAKLADYVVHMEAGRIKRVYQKDDYAQLPLD